MKDARARQQLRSFPSFVPFEPGDCNQAIHGRFEGQVAQRPDAIAIRQPGRDVSYAQLNAAANRRARRLIESLQTDATGRPVALLLPQGYDSIVSTLAILKTGSCYAPLDQRLPPAILRGMVDDIQPAAVLVDDDQRELGRAVAAGAFPVIDAAGTDDDRSAVRKSRPVDRCRRHRLHLLHVGLDRPAEKRRGFASQRPAQRLPLHQHAEVRARRSAQPRAEPEFQRHGFDAVRRAGQRRLRRALRSPRRRAVSALGWRSAAPA